VREPCEDKLMVSQRGLLGIHPVVVKKDTDGL